MTAETPTFSLSFPDMEKEQVNITAKIGDVIFVLGANGTGKSGLMSHIYNQHNRQAKRISAHRQTWFRTNALEYTPAHKVQMEENISQSDASLFSRWRDDYHDDRSKITIFELINAQNVRARAIADAVDASDTTLIEKLRKKEAPLKTLNHLLQYSNLPLEITVEADEKVFASKNGGKPYSVAELSDGERNAILIAADVLTAKPHTLFIIDEPERHLHRSIISPLLTALFQKRSDCTFIVATHDLGLPLDNPESSTLVIRGCLWEGKQIRGWDADIIASTDEINYQVKQDLLGARRTLLFVEGDKSSLDQHVYNIIFPEATIIPQGNCVDVERAIHGIHATKSLHWVNAIGIVDADDRTSEQIDKLKQSSIYCVSCYSVEALYYNPRIIELLADRNASVTGSDRLELIENAHASILTQMESHKARLCARLCERKVKASIGAPDWKEIQAGNQFQININLKAVLNEELKKFDVLIQSKDIGGLIERYPIRETGVLSDIAKALNFNTRSLYEAAVRQLLVDNDEAREHLRSLFGELVQTLTTNTAPEQEAA